MIKKITIKDLIKKDNNLEWEINGFKYLYGPNGVGKTTLLDSVYSIIEGDDSIWSIQGEEPRPKPYSEIKIEFTDFEEITYIGNQKLYSIDEITSFYNEQLEADVNFNNFSRAAIQRAWMSANAIEGEVLSKNIAILKELDTSNYVEIQKNIIQEFSNYIVNTKNQTLNQNRLNVKEKYQVLYITVERMAPDLTQNYRDTSVFKKWNKYKKVKTNQEIMSEFKDQIHTLIKSVNSAVNKNIGELINLENKNSKIDDEGVTILPEMEGIYHWILKYFSVESPTLINSKDVSTTDKPFTSTVINIVNEFNTTLIKSINSMRSFIKDINDFFSVNKKEVIWDDFLNEPIIKDDFSPNAMPISKYKFSSGERQIILILFNIHFFTKDKLLIIADEIEISLSPDWQDVLYKKISSMGEKVELIGVTHSPFVVSEEDMEQRLIPFKDEY